MGLSKTEWEEMVAPLVSTIGKGIAYLKCPSKASQGLVAIPWTTEQDLRRLLGRDDFKVVDEFAPEEEGTNYVEPLVFTHRVTPTVVLDTVKEY